MNAPVANACRQRRLFARFVSVCAFVAFALLLLPAAAHADGYSMTQTYIGATVEADGSLTVVEGRQFDFDDDINGVFWEINTGTNQQGKALRPFGPSPQDHRSSQSSRRGDASKWRNPCCPDPR